MNMCVLDLKALTKADHKYVGHKAANLGELHQIKGIQVPDGFCITTAAFKESAPIKKLTASLDGCGLNDMDRIRWISSEIRSLIEVTPIPQDVVKEIFEMISHFGENQAYAVRSSSTAEDLPTASFAGQYDTYLNVSGRKAILKHIKKCWASLFTERAVTYRLQNKVKNHTAAMAVIIQKMINPQASGIMFTADPATGNRSILSIDACLGLGERIVSGQITPDNYKVRNGRIISIKKRQTQVLNDQQIIELAQIGRQVEAHFGCPQDIEWCLADDCFYLVQSRPITTLFSIPAADNQGSRIFVSVGHQQMMTDPIKPLGLSFYLLTTRAPMYTAGGRLFVDVTKNFASPAGREALLKLGESDPLIKDALLTVAERKDLIADPKIESQPIPTAANSPPIREIDPEIVTQLIKRGQMLIAKLKQKIRLKSGTDLFEFILEDIQELQQFLFEPQSINVITTAMNAANWLNSKLEGWLGEKNTADILSRSVPNNITASMGLELLDVADAIRPYPEISSYLQQTKDENFLEQLERFPGGTEVKNAINAYLAKYGMRCPGEIDISRERWAEKPLTLLPLILSSLKNFESNARRRVFNQRLQEAKEKEQEILTRLQKLPDGKNKAEKTKSIIGIFRSLCGYREYPKYHMINRYFIYKQALLKEAEKLVQVGIIHSKDDIFYLTFDELCQTVRTQTLDQNLIRQRKAEYHIYERLTPPRVMTSEGEIIVGEYHQQSNLPSNVLPGLAVSSGKVEGRARVIHDLETAALEEGDILVTTYTDPGWTPLFLSIKGLVTEVGGLMTHGSVIAREYGLPAVVGVENATKLIKDGQKIRVNGTEGYIEILA